MTTVAPNPAEMRRLQLKNSDGALAPLGWENPLPIVIVNPDVFGASTDGPESGKADELAALRDAVENLKNELDELRQSCAVKCQAVSATKPATRRAPAKKPVEA